jgi:hypothetical protein
MKIMKKMASILILFLNYNYKKELYLICILFFFKKVISNITKILQKNIINI